MAERQATLAALISSIDIAENNALRVEDQDGSKYLIIVTVVLDS
jgi:hypothetical protein